MVVKILDRLYISDSKFTEEGLDQNKITNILNVGEVDDLNVFGRRYHHHHLLDGKGNTAGDYANIIYYINKTITVNYDGRLLVCCRAGLSRSAYVILLWLQKMGMSKHDAYIFIKECHPAAQINTELLRGLR